MQIIAVGALRSEKGMLLYTRTYVRTLLRPISMVGEKARDRK